MRRIQWAAPAAGILMIAACFMEWVFIASKNISVTGVAANGTDFGKPGYLHLVLTIIFLLFSYTPRLWAKRFNLAVTALNLAWAIRNYFLITTCRGGDCPEKKIGIYLVIIASILMLAAALFPSIKLPAEKNDEATIV